MNKKNILFLLGDIWSMDKNKGMPSVYKILELSQDEFNITIFTTDKNRYEEELSKANILYFNGIALNFKNKYLKYIWNKVNNIILNIKYIYFFKKFQENFDLVYCSSSIPIYSTYFIKKFYKIKTIHRIYGTFLYPKLGSKIDVLKKFEEVLSFKIKADRYIITDDGTLGDKVAKYYGINENKINFLRNGVNKIDVDKNVIKEKFKIVNNKFYCLCVSRLIGWKRVDRIVKAFNKIDNSDIILLVIGDGDEIDNLKNMKQNNNINFLGSLPAYDVHGLMQVCNLFISMYDLSNVGNPLLEALNYNMPIITYNSGNTKDVINGKNGILIEAQDENIIIDDLYRYILKIYGDNRLRDELIKNAKEYADKNLYSWDKRIQKEINIMKELIDER